MCDTWIGITNPGTRSYKSLPDISAFSRHLSLYNIWKFPSGSKAQNCIHAEALDYVIVNNFLFRMDTKKIKIETQRQFILVGHTRRVQTHYFPYLS